MNRSGVLLAFALAIAAIIASPVGPDGITKCYREECQPGQNPEQCKQCCEQLIQRFFKDVDAIRTGCIGNCSGSDPTIVPSSMIGFGDWFSWIPFIGPYLAQLFGGAAPSSPFDAILKSLNLPIPGAIAGIGAITGGASGSASGGLSGSAAGGITGGITKAITDAVSPILGILNPPKPNVTAAVISIPSSPFDDILKSLNLPIPGAIAGTGGVSGTATGGVSGTAAGGATGSISGSAAGGASGNATAGATGSATGAASGSIAGSATGAANATRAATGNATATATGTATGTAAGNATAATSSVTGALGSAVSNLLGGILG